jgi:DNA invertase Pin-like site-specific DNA recombinase
LLHPRLTARPTTAAVLGYATVARPPSGPMGAELGEQAQAIAEECKRRGLVLRELVQEWETGRARAVERPGLGYALHRISAGEASGLVVSDLSRLSPTVTQLGEVLERLLGSKIRVVAAAQGLDTAERGSRRAARTLIEVSGWERERLGERTRNGLKAARARGRPTVADNPQLREGIAHMRGKGMTLHAIADHLNATGVPTVRGGVKWRPSSVQAAAGYRRPPPGTQSGAPPGWKARATAAPGSASKDERPPGPRQTSQLRAKSSAADAR